MLYQAYQAQADIMTSLRGVAGIALQGFGQLHEWSPSLAESVPARNLAHPCRCSFIRQFHPAKPLRQRLKPVDSPWTAANRLHVRYPHRNRLREGS